MQSDVIIVGGGLAGIMAAFSAQEDGAEVLLIGPSISFAYITMDTGTGALILFASVQITMISLYIISGNRLHITEGNRS